MGASDNPFPHLKFQVVHSDRARLNVGGKPNPLTLQFKNQRPQHAARLHSAAKKLSALWHAVEIDRSARGLPNLPAGRPLLLLVDDTVDIDFLRSAFGFEIVAEEEDGYIIVATEDIDFTELEEILNKFLTSSRGGGSAAKLYNLIESTDERLQRILSDTLLAEWPKVKDTDNLVLDISISFVGPEPITDFPPRDGAETDVAFAARKASYLARHQRVVQSWDAIQCQRESEFTQFVTTYHGEVLQFTQTLGGNVFHLPDCFTVRARVSGACFKDLAQNHPHIFQITEVEPIEEPARDSAQAAIAFVAEIEPPSDDSASVCVMDSGIQENHSYLKPAIVSTESRCFLPGVLPTDTSDYVKPHGHGTRVAGAVLYPRDLPSTGTKITLPCWIHNARVLNAQCALPEQMMPALYMERVVGHYLDPSRARPARIFNHSINSRTSFRPTHMSTWGAAIDKLSYNHDVLIIQSAGNIGPRDVERHLVGGLGYPAYQLEASSRVRNPGQSLCALTVGSVSHVSWNHGQRASMAKQEEPSAFSTAGTGLWGSIKPDVVEYGGDFVVEQGHPARVFPVSAVACELVRSTLHSPGATSSDDVGTSFAAPKVSFIAAMLAQELPDEPCLLYRALIANSARWPDWAEKVTDEERLSVLRRIGYGIPSVERATTNTEYRVTLVSSGEQRIPAREAHIYHIPVPEVLRQPQEDFLIRIDISLAYASMPRRTRRRVRGYLATVLDWDVSKKGESSASFRNRIFNDGDITAQDGDSIFKWVLRDRSDYGLIQGASRQNSTLQKDWCYIRSHELPPDFCIAVVGHPGWDPSPETKAKYALAVSFEAVNADLRVYTPIRVALEAQVQVEVEQRIEVDTAPATE